MSNIDNPIFPGRYQSVKAPKSIVKVLSVSKGLVAVRSIEGPYMQALMGSQDFMRDYSRVQ